MPQFLVNSTDIRDNFATLQGEEAKHLAKVLRHKIGDVIWITDRKKRFRAQITSIFPKEVILKLIEEIIPRPKKKPPTLACALLKKDHLEWVIQKGVELGVENFILFSSERTVPQYESADTPKKLERFQKIADVAAKQSMFLGSPKIQVPTSLTTLIKNFAVYSAVLFPWESETEQHFKIAFQKLNTENILICIGPEGGFSEAEAHFAKTSGAHLVTLGDQILKSETAAITAIGLCQYELGNL